MQTITRSAMIERMLESADHLIEKHRGNQAILGRAPQKPQLPEGWIVYSAGYALTGNQKGWQVELIDTRGPFQTDSIVAAWHKDSLDAALQEASHKIAA